MSEVIAIGGDVSKGRVDVVFLNQSGTVLSGSGAYDDTHAGHERLRTHLRALEEAHPAAEIRVAVESTGGYERNWLALFRDERRRGKRIDFWRLNPLAVKKWLDSDLHRSVTDAHAARGIAAYLLARRPSFSEAEPTPHQMLYRLVRSARADRGVLEQQLQLSLGQVHPELVQYCRRGCPQWLLTLLVTYPTAAKVAHATPERLAKIPYLTAERASALKARAITSVASFVGEAAELSVGLLVERITAVDATIERYTKPLLAALANDPRVAHLDSITGIGAWTATCLLLEIGDVTRFASCRQLIAWAGLDAHDDLSGDGVIRRGISKRGNAYVRALLYMPTVSATASNPVIKTFYQRLCARGKRSDVALVAAMAKILRIAYALLVRGVDFDPAYETNRGERNQRVRQPAPDQTIPSQTTPPATTDNDLTAPISSREAARRRRARTDQQKAAAPITPYTGSKSQKATGTDRNHSLPTDHERATDQSAPRLAGGRHADAIPPTKDASEGPLKGPKRCRPPASRGADDHTRKAGFVT